MDMTHSPSELMPGAQYKRPRSRIACSRCRERKVRCDAAISGSPCTNCSLDQALCRIIPGRKRSRKSGFASSHPDMHLPGYIQSIPADKGMEEIEYMRTRGVFRLPGPAMRNKLWESFFHFVHPALPVLDREAIRDSLHMRAGAAKISLLVFHSVMLCGTLFAGAHTGRHTKPATLRGMYNRARLLYDLGWETDRRTNLQCLLLLSFYPQAVGSPNGSLSLISQAVSIAYTLGLHRDPASISPTNTRDARMRKRLWWCLYMRERLLVPDHGVPWIIHDEDHSVPMLDLDDFTEDPLWPGLGTDDIFSQHHERSQQRQIALVLIERAKLSALIGQLPTISLSSSEVMHAGSRRTMLGADGSFCIEPSSPTPALTTARLLEAGARLDKWAANIPLELVCIQRSKQPSEYLVDRGAVLSSNHAALMILYHTASTQWATLRMFQSPDPTRSAPRWTIEPASDIAPPAPESFTKTLWGATRPLLTLVEDSAGHHSLEHAKLLSPSLIRPFLLYFMLKQPIPFDPTPMMEMEGLQKLLTMVGASDKCFANAASSLEQLRVIEHARSQAWNDVPCTVAGTPGPKPAVTDLDLDQANKFDLSFQPDLDLDLDLNLNHCLPLPEKYSPPVESNFDDPFNSLLCDASIPTSGPFVVGDETLLSLDTWIDI